MDYKDENIWLMLGDCLERMKEIPDGGVDMVLADKIQNRKDFRLYHKGKHKRSKQLSAYFDIWIEFLLYLKYNKKSSNV